METMNAAQEERRRMLEEFRKRKEELRSSGHALNKAPLSVINSVRRLPATVKKNFPRTPFADTPMQRAVNKLPRTTVSNRLVLQHNRTDSQSSKASTAQTDISRFRTPASKAHSGRISSIATSAVTSRLTRGTLSSSLKSQNPQLAHKFSPKTARRSKLVHKKRSPVAKRSSPRINLSANRVTQVTLRRGPLNDVTLTSLRKPAQRVEVPGYTLKTPRRALRYATIATQTSPCMIVKLEPINTEPQEAPGQKEPIDEDDSGNVASIVHKFHLIQKQQIVESRKSAFTIPTPKVLQVIDPITKKILLEEFIPSRGISLFRLSKVVEYAKTGDVDVTRAMFQILGAPPKSGTVHITYTADYWIERSKFEEKCGNIEEALNLLQTGKEMKAKPVKEIKAAINHFVGRHLEFRNRIELEPISVRFQMDEVPSSNENSELICEVSENSNAMSDDAVSRLDKVKEQDSTPQLPREVSCTSFLSDDDSIQPPVLESNISFSEESSSEKAENEEELTTEDHSQELEDMTNMFDQVALNGCNEEASVITKTPSKVTTKGPGKASAQPLHEDTPADDVVALDLEAQQRPRKKLTGKRVDAVKEQLGSEAENNSSQVVYACITPSRKLRQSLDCNVVLTPVRRSARLARNADKLPPSLRQHSQTYNNLSELPEDMEFAWVPNDSVDVRKN